jgi:hypothetical protein
MYLIQILLPLARSDGTPVDRDAFRQVAEELRAEFGGLTAYTRAPATGLWEAPDGSTARDEIVILEVMAETFDRAWWTAYRRELERRFAQEELVVRGMPLERA